METEYRIYGLDSAGYYVRTARSVEEVEDILDKLEVGSVEQIEIIETRRLTSPSRFNGRRF